MTAVAAKPARVLPVIALLALGANRALAFLGAARPNSALRRRDGGPITTLVRPSNVPNCCQSAGGVADALPSQRPPSTTEREEEMLPAQSKGPATVAWVQLMLDSFEDTFGRGIIDGLDREKLSPEEQEREIDRSDVPIVSHDFLRNAEDPIFIYGNAASLRTFGYTWEEFTALPSRKSCEENLRGEREELLTIVREVDENAPPPQDFAGVRVTKTGESFRMSAAVWNVKDAEGRLVGQAARLTVHD
ncbi:unnamed protein product [Ectocarpus sp. 12 AP-2014]